MTEAVTFPNRKGRKLFGILHPASGAGRGVCVVLLSPGIKNRVAPHRLYVKLSRHLQNLGFDVFRFDPEGLGDSEGEFEVRYVADLYGAIQVGKFSEDTATALDWLEKEKRFDRFVVGGLCGGAITGLLEGVDDRRVDALLSFGIPVVLDSSEPGTVRFVSDGQTDKLRKGYIARLFQPRSWVRFLSFKTDYRVLIRSVFRSGRKRDSVNKEEQGPPEALNPHFPKAFQQFVETGRVMLLIFSGADRISWEFEELFASRHQAMLHRYADQIERYSIDGANHIMSFPEWQEEMFSVVDRWLCGRYPA